MNDEVILPIMSDSFVEAEAFKQKEQDFNATISSLKASLANEEAQKLEAKEARKVIEKELHSVREVFQRVLASPKVKFTAEEPLRSIMGHKLRRIMDYKHNIRNITVIAQASQGKSSLTDALVAATAAGIIAQDTAGDVRMTDTGISLYHHMTDEALKSFKGERNGNNYVINLIDSPAALCITDGALVVVDCIEGVCVQTETVLHQALVERVRPVLTVNNMDRCFLELQVDGERAYHIFSRVIKTVNVIMATYKDPLCGDVMVYPEKGTVAFSSGLHGWSFTLTNFAKMYAGKFGVDESKMMERLWGDNFFDPKTKKWTKEDTGAATCKRGFVQFCYDPIKHIINTCMNDEQDVLWPLLANLGVTMKSEEKELMGKPLMKRVMQNWLPAATALLEMVIFHLPSPHTAQRYRVENLYDGPLDDPYANAIKNCDRDGPVMLHVSKMIPAASGRFFAFGRVFAGTVSAGMKVRIRGPNFVPGEKKDLLYLYVKSVAIWMGKKQETVEDVPCGNTLSIMLSRIKEEEKSGGENLIAGLCLKDIEEDLMGGVKSDPAVSLCETVENKFVDLQDKLWGIQARLLKRRSFEDDEVITPSTSDSFVEAEALKQKVQELNATISNLETTISSLKASLANEESQKLEAQEARKLIEKELHSVREVFQRVLMSPKVKFTAEEPLRKLRRIMDNKHNIRNITVIAHVDHGKSTLTDSLVAAAAAAVGIIAQETAGDVRMTDTGISLYYQITDEALKSFKGERNGDDYFINLIDFSSDVTSALRITDGALVVVDCIEGVCVQTKTVLRQALGERIRPVLIIDKMDKCFLELKVDGEEAYQTFQRIIENFNLLMASYKDPVLGDSMVYPKKGTVVFSSGSHGWAFTLTNFAKMYAGKFGVDESKMMERLWGENFFDPKTNKWTKQNTGAATCKRGFVQLCYEPIQQIIDFCMNGKKDVLWLLLAKFGVTMKSEDKELMGKLLMKRVMQNWLPTAMALLEMMIFHLPSPHAAQRYRVDNLYQGPVDDAYANAIRNCDPNGPMVLYVSKMIPASDKGRFFAFGRVFAGKVSTGMKVRIMGPNYVPGEKKDLYVKSVQRTVIWMGKKQETIEDVPCGNTVAITVEGSGENIIAGICFEDLEEDFMGGAPIVESDLAVKGR